MIKLRSWEEAMLARTKHKRMLKRLLIDGLAWFLMFLAIFGMMYFLGGIV